MSVLDENLSLAKLIDQQSFREVCHSFAQTYAIGIRVFDNDGHKIVDIRASTADHCGYLFTVYPTKVKCTALVNQIRNMTVMTPGVTEPVKCFSGLEYRVRPIHYEGSIMGRIVFGPFAPDTLKESPSSLKEHESEGLNLKVLNNHLSNIPRVGDTAVAKVLEHIALILDVIIHNSYRTYLTSQMHITSISGAFEDLEKSNKELQAANTRLEELDRLKSNFIATVSHELRTPLTSVIGYSEMLLEGMGGPLSDDQAGYIRTILEKGESLLVLIGQVLDLSRIESGNVTIYKEVCEPAEIAKRSVSDVAPQAQRKKITLAIEAPGEIAPISLDPDKIRRVLTNLLGNAVKFTPIGGHVSLKVQVCDSPELKGTAFDIFEPQRNLYLKMEVSDDGVGIPKDDLDRIFDSFFQVDNSSTREFGGTGLGLSIARNFVKAHGGEIHVRSEVGKGTTFTVFLPYHSDPIMAPGTLGAMSA